MPATPTRQVQIDLGRPAQTAAFSILQFRQRQPHIVDLDGARRCRRFVQSEMHVTRPALLSFRQFFPHGNRPFQQAILISQVKGEMSEFA
jgi:hypothetical protein